MKHDMSNGLQKAVGRLQKAKRRVVSFEPSGPVAAMIENETRHGTYGAQTRLMEEALMALLGAKYPKCRARWEALREEQGKPVAA